MKKILIVSVCLAGMAIYSCKKDPTPTPTSTVTEAQVITDFANVLANPNYTDIQTKANVLNNAVITLNANTTDVNLAAARTAWRDTRTAWEQAEGYLFGPIEDFNYDPSMDTWPLNKVELDSLLDNSSTFTASGIDNLPFSLKGFHAIEYVLFGSGSSKTAAQITAKEKDYLAALSQSLYNTTTALANSWNVNHGNFTNDVINAGNGSTRFPTRNSLFLAIVGAMSDICNEVANEKMQAPIASITPDSTLDESSFSHNSTTDFKNNITGVLNAYTCKYSTSGHSLSQLVASKNLSLDQTIQSQLTAAVNSFNNVSPNYEQAIYTQLVQIHNTQAAINTLKNTLDNDLTNFVKTNIKD